MRKPTLLKHVNPEFLLSRGNVRAKSEAESEGKAIVMLYLGIHTMESNPDTIADAKKCLLTGAWYGYPLRDSAKA